MWDFIGYTGVVVIILGGLALMMPRYLSQTKVALCRPLIGRLRDRLSNSHTANPHPPPPNTEPAIPAARS